MISGLCIISLAKYEFVISIRGKVKCIFFKVKCISPWFLFDWDIDMSSSLTPFHGYEKPAAKLLDSYKDPSIIFIPSYPDFRSFPLFFYLWSPLSLDFLDSPPSPFQCIFTSWSLSLQILNTLSPIVLSTSVSSSL